MRKSYLAYTVAWFCALVLFNIVTFVTPMEINGVEKINNAFWIAYGFVTISFIGQIACTYFITKDESNRKLFYHIPTLIASIVSLALTTVLGTLCMAVIVIPDWLAYIVGSIAIVINIFAVLAPAVNAEVIDERDRNVAIETAFIRRETANAQALMEKAPNEEIKKIVKKVYEAFRYSDPMSSYHLSTFEDDIEAKYRAFVHAVTMGNLEETESISVELLYLIQLRNEKCKLFK